MDREVLKKLITERYQGLEKIKDPRERKVVEQLLKESRNAEGNPDIRTKALLSAIMGGKELQRMFEYASVVSVIAKEPQMLYGEPPRRENWSDKNFPMVMQLHKKLSESEKAREAIREALVEGKLRGDEKGAVRELKEGVLMGMEFLLISQELNLNSQDIEKIKKKFQHSPQRELPEKGKLFESHLFLGENVNRVFDSFKKESEERKRALNDVKEIMNEVKSLNPPVKAIRDIKRDVVDTPISIIENVKRDVEGINRIFGKIGKWMERLNQSSGGAEKVMENKAGGEGKKMPGQHGKTNEQKPLDPNRQELLNYFRERLNRVNPRDSQDVGNFMQDLERLREQNQIKDDEETLIMKNLMEKMVNSGIAVRDIPEYIYQSAGGRISMQTEEKIEKLALAMEDNMRVEKQNRFAHRMGA